MLDYLDYVHTVSFSLAFYIVLRPRGIRKQIKTLRKRHRVHVALGHSLQGIHDLDYTENTMRSVTVKVHKLNKNMEQ